MRKIEAGTPLYKNEGKKSAFQCHSFACSWRLSSCFVRRELAPQSEQRQHAVERDGKSGGGVVVFLQLMAKSPLVPLCFWGVAVTLCLEHSCPARCSLKTATFINLCIIRWRYFSKRSNGSTESPLANLCYWLRIVSLCFLLRLPWRGLREWELTYV